MEDPLPNDDEKRKKVLELTSLFLHGHYRSNDAQQLLAHIDDAFSWIGTAEHEYSASQDTTTGMLPGFGSNTPCCDILDEHYDVIQSSGDIFICSGRLCLGSTPANDSRPCIRQRITTVFRWSKTGPRCCHMHLSVPFPDSSEHVSADALSTESGRHYRRQIEEQKKTIEQQQALIQQIYYEDLSTGLYNRNRFNMVCEELRHKECSRLGIAYFDLNGLKRVNDHLGHHAGDELLGRTAGHLRRFFPNRAYRIGGDEFLIIDEASGRDEFSFLVFSAVQAMHNDGIAISHGICWRSSPCSIDEQIEEADKNMYQVKQNFYAKKENNRRRNDAGDRRAPDERCGADLRQGEACRMTEPDAADSASPAPAPFRD